MRNYTNDTFFDIIDSDLKAYLLGFFIADGCIIKDNKTPNRKAVSFSVNLSERDRFIIDLFNNNICPDNKITISHHQKGAVNRLPTAMCRWSSKYMYNTLLNKYNIKPRKTYDIDFKFPIQEIEEVYIKSFIRGFFDGDGHISYGNKQFTLAFYGTNKLFLQQIGEIISHLFSVHYILDSNIKTTMELFCLRFNSNSRRREFINNLYNWFYKDQEYFLLRKKEKFEAYLNTVLTKEYNNL